ncbi:hypothetical protein BDQ17DRAFT_142498, partial [Cyathus striatus]
YSVTNELVTTLRHVGPSRSDLLHHLVDPVFTTAMEIPTEIFATIIATFWHSILSFEDRKRFITSSRAVNTQWRLLFLDIFWNDIWICSQSHFQFLLLDIGNTINTSTRSISIQSEDRAEKFRIDVPFEDILKVLDWIHWDFIPGCFPNVKTVGVAFCNTGLMDTEYNWLWTMSLPPQITTLELSFVYDSESMLKPTYSDFTNWAILLDYGSPEPSWPHSIQHLKLWNIEEEFHTLAWSVFSPLFNDQPVSIDMNGQDVLPPVLDSPYSKLPVRDLGHIKRWQEWKCQLAVKFNVLATSIMEFIAIFDIVPGMFRCVRIMTESLSWRMESEFEDILLRMLLNMHFSCSVWKLIPFAMREPMRPKMRQALHTMHYYYNYIHGR